MGLRAMERQVKVLIGWVVLCIMLERGKRTWEWIVVDVLFSSSSSWPTTSGSNVDRWKNLLDRCVDFPAEKYMLTVVYSTSQEHSCSHRRPL